MDLAQDGIGSVHFEYAKRHRFLLKKKKQGISRIAENQLASEEGLRSLELVSR